MADSKTIFLSLGSNLGDRQAVLASAREQIAKRVGRISIESSVYETEPWGVADQPAFLNQVIQVKTDQTPKEVLRIILDIEHDLGRVRSERWGARMIDIDVLYYNALVLDTAELTLPHPRLQERLFNLIPLAEIAPDFVNPLLKKTSFELLQMCKDTGVVSKIS